MHKRARVILPSFLRGKTPDRLQSSEESVSIFLDLLRFLAALYVFISHTTRADFSSMPWMIGHDAVIIFFVLSGYVIALTTEKKDKTLCRYALARLARLYSVVIPALLLTYVADSVGIKFDPGIYDPDSHSHIISRLLAALTFTTQIWFLDIQPLSNTPFWSLPYEFWYYFLWGIIFYVKGWLKNILLILTILFIGPKILLYLPIWLLGVAVYHARKIKFNGKAAVGGIMAGIACLPVLYVLGKMTRSDLVILSNGNMAWRSVPFLPNGFSFYDYLIAIVIAIIILLFPSTGIDLKSLKKPVCFFANRTFSLYLYHYPLLHFFIAVTPVGLSFWQSRPLIISLTFISCLVLAEFTELKKRPLATLFNRIISY